MYYCLMDTTSLLNSFPVLRNASNYYEALDFIENAKAGEMLLKGAIGENYVLSRNSNSFALGYPAGDYSGDPYVVDTFNRLVG